MKPLLPSQASTFQMAILLQYNSSASYTVQQLADNTQLKMDILLQVLHLFLPQRVACFLRHYFYL